MSQNKLIDHIDRRFVVIADWSIKHRLIVILLALVMLGAGLFFTTKVQFDGSLEGFFRKSDPVYADYLEYLEEFSSDEITYILYRVPEKEHGPFDFDTMQIIGELTEDLENEVPFTKEATSLTNVEFMFSEGDTLIIDELMINFPENQEQLLEVRDRVMDKPIYVNYLINESGDYAAIFVESTAASSDPLDEIIYDPAKGEAMDNLYPQATDIKVREILNRPQYADSGIEFFLTGDPPMNSTYNNLYMTDSAIISLVTLALVAVISFLLLRTSLAGLLAPVSVVVLSVIMMLGVIGFLGWSVGLFITMAPSLICAIGVAQAVHILQEYHRSMALQGNKRVAVRRSIKKVGGPCMLAAATTAAGFAVMGVSDLQGLAEFGYYAAFGVIFTFILSITLLVVFLASGPNAPRMTDDDAADSAPKTGTLAGVNPLVRGIVERSIALNARHPKAIMLGFALVFLAAFAGLSRLSIDFNFVDEFEDHVVWKQDTLLADEVMGGVLSFSYMFETKDAEGAKDIELLKGIERLQQFAEAMPIVKKTFSMADVLKDLNRTFHADDPAYYRIPDDQALVAQLLLIYEISGGDELYEQVNMDFSRTIMDMRVVMTDVSQMQAMVNEIEAFLKENPIPGVDARPTGIGLLWLRIADYISQTQITAYSLIFAMIALVMIIAYGSFKVGMLSMIPNVTPVLVTLGAMGWLGISLDYMKLLLATIAIGIAVDDTIHLVTRFRSRFYELGNYSDAMAASLRDVGPALTITTLILIGGFGGYFVTDMAVLTSFGILLGACIALALVADLLLLPVIFMTLKPFGPETSPSVEKAGAPLPAAGVA